MARQLIVWRHGQTDWNIQQRIQGQTDIPLNKTGIEQAHEAAARLASLRPDRIVSSDLARARQTAEVLGSFADLDVSTDPRFREMNFGVREGLTQAEANERYPDEMRGVMRHDPDFQMTDGESYRQTADRFAAGLRDVVDAMRPDETAVVVAHGAAISVGVLSFVGLPGEYWKNLGGFNNCCWTVLEEGRLGWRITEWNAGQLPAPMLSDDDH